MCETIVMDKLGILRLTGRKKVPGIRLLEVFGLNIFTENTREPASPLLRMQNLPLGAFIQRMASSHDIICVIGGLAIEEWTEDRSRRREKVSIDTLVPHGAPCISVPILLWGGRFKGDEAMGTSLVFPLQAMDFKSMLDLFDHFLWRDAVAFLMYEGHRDGLNAARKTLEECRFEEQIVESLTREAKYFLRTQGECESLEVISRSEDVDREVDAAMEAAVQSIESTPWYQQNKERLSWDDLNSCLVLR